MRNTDSYVMGYEQEFHNQRTEPLQEGEKSVILHALISPPFKGIAIFGLSRLEHPVRNIPLGHRDLFPQAIPHYLLIENVQTITGLSSRFFCREYWTIHAPDTLLYTTIPKQYKSECRPVPLVRYSVPVITLSYETCLDVFASLHGVHDILLGDTLLYLLTLFKSACILARDGRCKPAFIKTHTETQAAWTFALCPEDTVWLTRFAAAMPPIMRYASDQKNMPTVLPSHKERLSSALSGIIETIVRQALTKHSSFIRPGKRMREQEKDALAFMASLTGQDLHVQNHSMDTGFVQNMSDWLSFRKEGYLPFRTCIRVREPAGEELEPWFIELTLRALSDPDLFIPARMIWNLPEESGGMLPAGSILRQELLSGLAQSVAVSKILKDCFSGSNPTTGEISLAQAATFLTAEALAVKDAGVDVILPSWWNDEKYRPRIELSAQKKDPTRRDGMLGISELIAFDYRIAIGDESYSPEEFWQAVRQNTPLIKMKGRWIVGNAGSLSAALTQFERRYIKARPKAGDLIRLSAIGQTDSDLKVTIRGNDKWATDILSMLMSGGDVTEYTIPKTLNGRLRPYQEIGHAFLLRCSERGFGACLADDMGLGKTIQTIAWFLSVKEKNSSLAPALIVCPMSVVGNWEREIHRFAPSLSVWIHHGSSRCRGDDFIRLIHTYDMILTTYNLAARDLNHLAPVSWSAVILDEAQNIKNPHTRVSQAVRQLTADRRIALTGTPVENRLLELWSIMDFLNPGYLGSQHAFQSRYGHLSGGNTNTVAMTELRLLIRPFLLRRMKTDKTVIADLPDKMESKMYCTLTREQATLYQAVVSDMAQSLDVVTGFARRGVIFRAITRLKQICNHPGLMIHDNNLRPEQSGKVSRLLEMLEEVSQEGDSALIFTQYATFAEYIAAILREQFSIPVLLLTGKTPRRERERLVHRFQSSNMPLFFVISLKAGGTGLNLTAATHVFHVDRWWNPAIEDQATDRTFRIGQKQNVQVHLMIAAGTLEEQIDRINCEKRVLGQEVLGQGEDLLTSLSTEEVLDLVSLRDAVLSEEEEE
ncbi:DEAD/DEAH box helicase [Methanospirillum sp.]|uniref:DEAD/DEAH box helicase n=1 Tax=Methanospirillum sp. TaxID=45200 RepID=UPI002B984A58|nr:DEAD/DEAH box helicase [Methanospirillum sp.]HPP78289.1 DEAD/DEAH box helicase [Methanospirillum sp.]